MFSAGNNQYCPTRSYAGLWEMVINPLVQGKETCPTIDQCPTKLGPNDVYNTLMDNFKRHYLTNRAPFGIHINPIWLKSEYDYLAEFKVIESNLTIKVENFCCIIVKRCRQYNSTIEYSSSHNYVNFTFLTINSLLFQKFVDEILKLPDVYFVTNRQVIEWIKRPTPVLQLKNFFPWMCKDRRFTDFEVACLQATTCKLPTQMMALDRYMITCTECPKTYPWLRNEFGVE